MISIIFQAQLNRVAKVMNKKILLVLLLTFIVALPVTANEDRLRLAITTTTENSGLMSRLNPVFEKQYGVNLDVVVVGSGQAFRLGSNGDIDVLLVHAPAAEKEFIDTGHGIHRTAVMHNEFILLGPGDDPLQIKDVTSIIGAFMQIREHEALFVSRGDESGTHKKEQALWQSAGIHEYGSGYRSSGRGMGATRIPNGIAIIDAIITAINEILREVQTTKNRFLLKSKIRLNDLSIASRKKLRSISAFETACCPVTTSSTG